MKLLMTKTGTRQIARSVIGLSLALGLGQAASAMDLSGNWNCAALCGQGCYDLGDGSTSCTQTYTIAGNGSSERGAYSKMTAMCPGTFTNNSAVKNYFYITPPPTRQQVNSNFLDEHPELACHQI